MKKIQIISLFAFLAITASCDMNKLPYSAIETGHAIENVDDCKKLRIGLYSGMKFRTSGGNVYLTDYQTDFFHALKNFGNWGGLFYTWTFNTSEEELATSWSGYYATINNSNFLIEGSKKLLESGKLSSKEVATVNTYLGEAYFMRAFAYYEMALKFCKDYTPATLETDYGLPVVTVYSPSSNAGSYPSRSNMKATYARIAEDITEAGKLLTNKGASMSAFLNADIVTAFKARLALTMHQYPEAITYASTFIDSETYPLISDKEKFAGMWLNDVGTEIIWRITFTMTSRGNTSGPYYLNTTDGTDVVPQYVPEKWFVDAYPEGDIRFPAYFTKRSFETPVVGNDIYLFNKFPGNKELYTGNTNYVNMPKVFRTAEMYLIAAEASALSGSDAAANIYLTKLRTARIPGYTKPADYTDTELMNEIRLERARELCGEGFRLADLKRWGMGIKRSAGQDPAIVFETASTLDVDANNPRFVWPIPQKEINANPQIKPQQNPGY